MSSPVTMSRQELYDLVWSKPMRDAAATIPMSDVGLKKACRRHNVPVPPRGYWNKVRAGHRMPARPALPPPVEGQRTEFEPFAPAPLHGAALASLQRAERKSREPDERPSPEAKQASSKRRSLGNKRGEQPRAQSA